MSKIIYKYTGTRRGKNGVRKTFDSKDLTESKIKRLEEKGWKKVPKKKPKTTSEK
jgi:hypothetical protein